MRKSIRILLKVFISIAIVPLVAFLLPYPESGLCGCPSCPITSLCDCACFSYLGSKFVTGTPGLVLYLGVLALNIIVIPGILIFLFNKFLLKEKKTDK